MERAQRRLLRGWQAGLLGGAAAGLAAALVVLWHRLMTPQELQSALPGEARFYRWREGHIFYTVAGPEQAPPLVLWHAPGLAASAYTLRRPAALLAERYRVYAPDLLGFGLSDRPALSYNGALYVQLIGDFLREVVGQPAVLLGEGLSGRYALAVAVEAPELCRGLILLTSPASAGEGPGCPLLASLARLPVGGLWLYCLLTTRLALRYLVAPSGDRADLAYLYATTHQFGAEHAPRAWLGRQLLPTSGNRLLAGGAPLLLLQEGQQTANGRHLLPGVGQAVESEMVAAAPQGYGSGEEVGRAILAWLARHEEISDADAQQSSAREPAAPAPVTTSAGPPEEEDEAGAPAAEEEEITAYCVRCKRKTAMRAVQVVTMRNGRPALQGICALCGAKMYRIGRLT
jgi:pimeloyl-ACP methyl ester carboxylesterase